MLHLFPSTWVFMHCIPVQGISGVIKNKLEYSGTPRIVSMTINSANFFDFFILTIEAFSNYCLVSFPKKKHRYFSQKNMRQN